MAHQFKKPTLYVEHQPETHRTVEDDKSVSEVELPGTVEVGVEVDGARIPLARVKAGHVLEAVELASADKAKSSRA